ncbi:MAG TPA: DNA-binding protein [Anaerolineales bacterium]|nr:DNA-binding protein [Anaerolineae bacterium]HIP88182.1 DNA-binding protein [Anaerolineales bacterium]
MIANAFNPTDWITTKEAAELTGYHAFHIRRLAKEGKIEGIKRGRDWWVKLSSVRKYAEEMKRLGAAKHSPQRRHSHTG